MRQVGGHHYEDMKIQPFDIIKANGMGFFDGNVLKYIMRYRYKGGVTDLKKALHYLHELIKEEETRCQSQEQNGGNSRKLGEWPAERTISHLTRKT